MAIGGIASGLKRYTEYGANFVFGTGSETIGQSVKAAVQARKATGTGLFKAIGKGFGEGVKATNATIAKEGFFKNLWKSLKELPNNMGKGWVEAGKSGGNLMSKCKGFLKPIGKVLPFAINALIFLQSVPSIISRTKDEGIWGGIKETGKSLAKLGTYALGGALGAAFGPIGSLACMLGLSMIGEKILGPDYKQKKAEEAAIQEQGQAAQGITNPFEANKFQKFNAVA